MNWQSISLLSRVVFIPQSTIRSIVQKEDYEVREGNIHKICKGMGIRPYEMFQEAEDEILFLSQDEIPVVKKYRKLYRDDKCQVQGYVDALIGMNDCR